MGLLTHHQLNKGQEIQIRSNLSAYNQKAVIRWSTNLNDVLYKAGLEYEELERQIQEHSKAEAALRKNEKELTKRVKELDEFYNIAVGRELRMIELKEEIESLKKELGKYNKHEI